MFKVDSYDALIYLWKIWRLDGAYPPAKHKLLYSIYAVLITFVTDILSPLLVFINIIFLRDEAAVMRNIETSPTLIAASLKQFVIFFEISNLYQVKSLLHQLDDRANRNRDEIKYLRKVVKQSQFLTKAVRIVLVASMVSYAVTILLKGRLFVEGWLPFDWTLSTSNYIVGFSYQFLAISFLFVQIAANDAYPPLYIKVLMGHIRVLGMRVARIGKDSKTTSEENYNELKSCVKDHVTILRLFETIKPVISITIMIQYIITAFVICVAVIYYLKFDRRLSQLLNTLVYVFLILAQVFPVSYFGNALMDETDDLTTAIYNCNWVDQSIKFRKTLIIFMQRSQKTNVIMAGGMALISLQTFISIIKFSFSMYTAVSQFD